MGILFICGKAVTIGATPVNFDLQDPQIYVTPATIINIPYSGATYNVSVCGAQWNKTCVVDACTWITCGAASVTPTATPGTTTTITVEANPAGGVARSGSVCYLPQSGCATKTVTVCQLCSPSTTLNVSMSVCYCGGMGDNINGMACLMCSNNTSVICETCIDTSTSTLFNWNNVPAGCYYVDMSGVLVYLASESIITSYSWSDCYGSDSTSTTGCFNNSNAVCFVVYDGV